MQVTGEVGERLKAGTFGGGGTKVPNRLMTDNKMFSCSITHLLCECVCRRARGVGHTLKTISRERERERERERVGG